MTSKGIIKNANHKQSEPIVSDQGRTHVAESLASQPPHRPEFRGLEVPESRIACRQEKWP